MQLARCLGGNYPYRTYVPVYDATILAEGELLMRGTAWHSGANKYYITAYAGDNTEAEDTIGITCASSTDSYASKENAALYNLASAVPSRGPSTGSNFLETIVNCDATYFAFYDQTDVITQTGAVAASTTWAITSLEDNIDGGWLFTTDQADADATYSGALRYATASAAGSITTADAVTVDTSTDVCKVLPIGHRLVGLNAEATGLTSTAQASDTIYLEIRENYLTHNAQPKRPLRKWLNRGLDDLKQMIVEGEIIQLKHAYRGVVV